MQDGVSRWGLWGEGAELLVISDWAIVGAGGRPLLNWGVAKLPWDTRAALGEREHVALYVQEIVKCQGLRP